MLQVASGTSQQRKFSLFRNLRGEFAAKERGYGRILRKPDRLREHAYFLDERGERLNLGFRQCLSQRALMPLKIQPQAPTRWT